MAFLDIFPHRALVGAFALTTACTPEAATEATSGGATATTGAEQPTMGTGDATTEAPPVLDCDIVPTTLGTPKWAWIGVPDDGEPWSLAAGPEGDAIFLRLGGPVERFAAGSIVWSHAADEQEFFGEVATLPDGRTVVAGSWQASWDEPGERLLALIDVDGARLATHRHDTTPGGDEVVRALGVSPAGDVALVVQPLSSQQPNPYRLSRYDAAFEHAWSLDVPRGLGLGVGFDAEGGVYLASADFVVIGGTGDNQEYEMTIRVDAFEPDGAPRWTHDLPNMPAAGLQIPTVVVSPGDHIYVFVADSRSGNHSLTAWTPAGELVWTDQYESGQSEPVLHRLSAAAASPCGGVYVGGRSGMAPNSPANYASLFHIDANGAPGLVTYFMDTPPDGFEYERTLDLAVTPLGRIVARGRLRSETFDDAATLPWVRAY